MSVLSIQTVSGIVGANFNSTADQAFTIPLHIRRFILLQDCAFLIKNASISLTTAVGGFYTAAAKGGTPLVAATQVYSTLTTSSKVLVATVAAAGLASEWVCASLGTASTIYFALTTPQGAAATADIYFTIMDTSP